jgi:hypothetical protein
MKKKIFGSNQTRFPHGLTHFTSCNFNVVFCIIYCNNTQKIAFELDKIYIQLPSFYLPSLQGTKHARYMGISNIFICLRVFLLFFHCFCLLPPFLYAQPMLPRLSRLPGEAAVGHKNGLCLIRVRLRYGRLFE